MDQLEDTGAFTDVIPRQDEARKTARYRSVIQGYYLQSGKPARDRFPAAGV